MNYEFIISTAGMKISPSRPQRLRCFAEVRFRPRSTTTVLFCKEVTLTSGETFYEGPDDVHVVGRNASSANQQNSWWSCFKNQGAKILVPQNGSPEARQASNRTQTLSQNEVLSCLSAFDRQL
jgi:hypothetical protein